MNIEFVQLYDSDEIRVEDARENNFFMIELDKKTMKYSFLFQ